MRALRTQAEWFARVQMILGVGVIVILCGFIGKRRKSMPSTAHVEL